MPMKRKSKAAKNATKPPAKLAANRNSVGAMSNKRTAGTEGAKMHVSSRLAPSVPFQMTTRRGAKTTSSHTSPTAPSSASSGSRRSSLNDDAQFQEDPSDLEDERPAKRSRTLTDSGSPQRPNGSHINHAAASMDGTQTPELQEDVGDATPSTPKATGKRRRASDESTQSSKTMGARPNGLLTRTQSDISEQQPRRKKRKKTETPADSADQPPELTDASTAPNSPEPIPEVDGSQNLQNVLPTNGDAPAKSGRRLPGRRRQPHPDVNIETDLRRQLNLKMSYRSLAKIQKSLLEELSSRTLKNLDKDAEFHTKCPEYKPLMAALDQHRDSRLDQIHAMRQYRLEQLECVQIAEKQIQDQQFINRFRELQDDLLLQCYFKMKRIEREMKYREVDATDDEENVLPPTYTDEPHHNMDDRVGSKYASRSRAYIEADRELEKESVRRRFDLARFSFVEQNDDADDSIEDSVDGFARFDGPDRTEAFAHYNLACLADAATEAEKTLPNEQATSLMFLADLSAQLPRTSEASGAHVDEKSTQIMPNGTSQEPVPVRTSSAPPSPNKLPSLPTEIGQSSPAKAVESSSRHDTEVEPISNINLKQEPDVESSKPSVPARVSTHRIMDILNDDREVRVSRVRESQLQSSESAPTSVNDTGVQHDTAAAKSHPRVSGATQNEETPVDQALMDALEAPTQAPSNPPSPPPQPQQVPILFQPNVSSSSAPEEALRRRDPLQKIRELLDRKAREHGREPTDRAQPWRPPYWKYNSATPSQDRSEVVGYDPQRPSIGMYGASPTAQPAHPSMARRESKDHGHTQWEHDRRLSGPQASQQPAASPYQGSAPAPYKGEHQRTDPTPPAHHSPYAPPGSGSLPAKPPGPPPSAPINFRFAHYDPVPPRQPYPPPSPSYPPASSPVHPPPQPHYAPAYGAPPLYQGGYIPPPGSFQAPPPPPPSVQVFPPLKIHQYGGQPILPANMAPPPQHSGPPMTFVGQTSLPPVYPSPNQTQPSVPHYEQRDASGAERPPEPQSRPRRPYRSYHAPGTQFRSYQGPGERRRGG